MGGCGIAGKDRYGTEAPRRQQVPIKCSDTRLRFFAVLLPPFNFVRKMDFSVRAVEMKSRNPKVIGDEFGRFPLRAE